MTKLSWQIQSSNAKTSTHLHKTLTMWNLLKVSIIVPLSLTILSLSSSTLLVYNWVECRSRGETKKQSLFLCFALSRFGFLQTHLLLPTNRKKKKERTFVCFILVLRTWGRQKGGLIQFVWNGFHAWDFTHWRGKIWGRRVGEGAIRREESIPIKQK